jgi:hypothetical protein
MKIKTKVVHDIIMGLLKEKALAKHLRSKRSTVFLPKIQICTKEKYYKASPG